MSVAGQGSLCVGSRFLGRRRPHYQLSLSTAAGQAEPSR
jgi:hypothetical protein